ncbi:MAG: AraC family transcriptional regulator [Ferruginibacter sp.]
MEANVHILFSSDHYEIYDFRCLCNECTRSRVEYNEHLSLSFIRSGNFYYNAFNDKLDSYTGSVLISKAGYDYTVTHQGNIPDECTIIIFKRSFYEDIEEQLQLKANWFFSNKDMQSLLLKTNPEIEQLHYTLLQATKQKQPYKLELDTIVMEIVEKILLGFTDYEWPQGLSAKLKKHHLTTIEKAKHYINENLSKNISLEELAAHCCISPFHFSRIFKTFTGYAVHQYLQLMRLKHAQILLTTHLPVADIAFQSGFNSLDYFSSAFKKEYKLSPSAFRTSQKTARFHK